MLSGEILKSERKFNIMILQCEFEVGTFKINESFR